MAYFNCDKFSVKCKEITKESEIRAMTVIMKGKERDLELANQLREAFMKRENGPDQAGKGCGRRKSAADRHGGTHRRVKAGKGIAPCGQNGGNAADKGGGGAFFFGAKGKIAKIHRNGGKAVGKHTEDPLVVGGNGSGHGKVDGGCHHMSALMVGVVPDKLAPSGTAEKADRLLSGMLF